MSDDGYMSDEMFAELVKSMKEAVAITNGKACPARVFSYPETKAEETVLDKKPLNYTPSSYQHSYAIM